MATRKSAGPQSSLAVPLSIAALVVFGALSFYHLPGAFGAWAVMVFAAFNEPAFVPEAKGKVAPHEVRKQRKAEYWSSAKTSLFTGDWGLGAAMVAALVVAFICFFAPEESPSPEVDPAMLRAANGLAALLLVGGLTKARRSASGSPGLKFKDLKNANKPMLVGLGVLGAVVATAFMMVAGYPVEWGSPRGVLGCSFVLGALGGMYFAWSKVSLTRWRAVERRRPVWGQVWYDLNKVPGPRVVDTAQGASTGGAIVDTLEARGAAREYIEMGPGKIAPLLDAARVDFLTVPRDGGVGAHPNRFAVVQWEESDLPDLFDPETPDEVRTLVAGCEWSARWKPWKVEPADVSSSAMVGPARVDVITTTMGTEPYLAAALKFGATLPGRSYVLNDDGLKFRVVSWPSMPSAMDPDVDPEVLLLAIECALSQGAVEYKTFPAGVPDGLEQVGDPERGCAWAVTGNDVDWRTVRDSLADYVGGTLGGAGALTDHRKGVMWLGDLNAITDEDVLKVMQDAADEDVFNHVWEQALKQGQAAPTYRPNFTERRMYADQRTEVVKRVFTVMTGQEPTMFFGLESKLRTAMSPMPKYIAEGPWVRGTGRNRRAGEGDAAGFCLYTADRDLPQTPTALRPSPASEWILVGFVNKAFKDARLAAQPTITKSRALTSDRSRQHVWEVRLRLNGGDTYQMVRVAMSRIKGSLGVDWLRLAPGDDGVVMYCGAHPASVTLADPRMDQHLVDELNWAQAWAESGVTGVDGLLPVLEKTDRLERNEKVQVLDFRLPSGLDRSRVESGLSKLKGPSGNVFLQVESTNDPSLVRMMACSEDPMPFPAPYELGTVKEMLANGEGIAFASGVTGEVISWNPQRQATSLLVVGMPGAGKSYGMNQLVAGIMLMGADLFIVDVQKGAADFRWVEPYTRIIAREPFEALATMIGVYEEFKRRRDLNSAHGAANYTKLPSELRPKPWFVVVDEIQAMIEGNQKPPSEAPEDPEMVEAWQDEWDVYNAKNRIVMILGLLVKEARAAGIHCIAAGQKMKADTLNKVQGGGSIKDGSGRMLLGKAGPGDKASALRDAGAAPDLGDFVPRGRGVLEPTDGPTEVIQMWGAPPDELLSYIAEERDPAERFDFAPFMPVKKAAAGGVEEIDLDEWEVQHEASAEPFVDEEFDLDLGGDDGVEDVLKGGGLPEGFDLDLSALVVGADGSLPTVADPLADGPEVPVSSPEADVDPLDDGADEGGFLDEAAPRSVLLEDLEDSTQTVAAETFVDGGLSGADWGGPEPEAVVEAAINAPLDQVDDSPEPEPMPEVPVEAEDDDLSDIDWGDEEAVPSEAPVVSEPGAAQAAGDLFDVLGAAPVEQKREKRSVFDFLG